MPNGVDDLGLTRAKEKKIGEAACVQASEASCSLLKRKGKGRRCLGGWATTIDGRRGGADR